MNHRERARKCIGSLASIEQALAAVERETWGKAAELMAKGGDKDGWISAFRSLSLSIQVRQDTVIHPARENPGEVGLDQGGGSDSREGTPSESASTNRGGTPLVAGESLSPVAVASKDLTQTQLMRILEVALDDILKQFPVGYDCRITELAGGALATLETWKQNPGERTQTVLNECNHTARRAICDECYQADMNEAEGGGYIRGLKAAAQAPTATCPDCWADVTGYCPKCSKSCAAPAASDLTCDLKIIESKATYALGAGHRHSRDLLREILAIVDRCLLATRPDRTKDG